MLVSKTNQGKWINVADNLDNDYLIRLRKEERFFCPECKEEVILKIGTKRISHFSHKKGSVCIESYERESEYHLKGKLQIFKWLHSQDVNPVLEDYEQAIAQRPDISFIYNGSKYAIEYQCSPIPTELFLKRTFTYTKANIIPIWILGGKHITRKGYSAASLSSFEYLFLRKTASHQWFLQAFCPISNDLISLKNIMPFSIKNVHTQFSVTNLTKAKLNDLLQPSTNQAFSLNKWRTEMRKWKNTAALYGTPKNKFLQELYSNALIPSLLPPAIGLPVVHLPYIETPPIQWQSYIILDLLKQELSTTLEHILQSFHARIRKQDVKLRPLPLCPNNNYQHAVKEYIDILLATNIVQKMSDNHLKLNHPLVIAKYQMEQEQLEHDFYQKNNNIIYESLKKNQSFSHKDELSFVNG